MFQNDHKSYGVNNYNNHYQHKQEEEICNCKQEENTKPGYLMELIHKQRHQKPTELMLQTSKERIHTLIKRALKQKKKVATTLPQ